MKLKYVLAGGALTLMMCSGLSAQRLSTPWQVAATGDPVRDAAATEAAKTEWVKTHEVEYSSFIAAMKVQPIQSHPVALSSFPAYVNTGNPSADDAQYAAKKQEWIDNNQALYNSMVDQPSKTVSTSDPAYLKSLQERRAHMDKVNASTR